MALTLTTDERAELERRVRSLKIRAEDARRARVMLMLADGCRSPEPDRRSRLILWLIAGQDMSCWLRSSSRFDLSR
jgi:hypothetical protein